MVTRETVGGSRRVHSFGVPHAHALTFGVADKGDVVERFREVSVETCLEGRAFQLIAGRSIAIISKPLEVIWSSHTDH